MYWWYRYFYLLLTHVNIYHPHYLLLGRHFFFPIYSTLTTLCLVVSLIVLNLLVVLTKQHLPFCRQPKMSCIISHMKRLGWLLNITTHCNFYTCLLEYGWCTSKCWFRTPPFAIWMWCWWVKIFASQHNNTRTPHIWTNHHFVNVTLFHTRSNSNCFVKRWITIVKSTNCSCLTFFFSIMPIWIVSK